MGALEIFRKKYLSGFVEVESHLGFYAVYE
jgi:hypothetical protein